jgi:hypothetical protein
MALIILQHNLGVTNDKCGHTDYPDRSFNFFLQDLRSTAHSWGGQRSRDGVWLSRKILKSYMLEEWWIL